MVHYCHLIGDIYIFFFHENTHKYEEDTDSKKLLILASVLQVFIVNLSPGPELEAFS